MSKSALDILAGLKADELRQQIASLESDLAELTNGFTCKISGLKVLLKAVELRDGSRPPRKKPERKPKDLTPPKQQPKLQSDDRRSRMHDYLRAAGSAKLMVIAADCDIPSNVAARLLNHEWFTFNQATGEYRIAR